MASFAITTVFSEESTRSGIGRYCSAVNDATMADGWDEWIDIESLLCIELGDFGRSVIGKYPDSASPKSSDIMINGCEAAAKCFGQYDIGLRRKLREGL